jgi:translation initiation factor 2 subunit 1
MEYPERDELVVVQITQILDYGVFVELLEYNNARGFVHISNVSSSWVKNIRMFVKANQVRVAKVLNIDTVKKQIDLSFAGVSPQREKQKLSDFKQVNREEKLIHLLAKQENKKFDDVWNEVANPLIEEYDSLYVALEKVALGEDIEKFVGKAWIKPIQLLVEKNVVVSKKVLKGTLKLSSLESNGLNDVKKLLSEIKKFKGCSISYGGAGTYIISFESSTFKEAEKEMRKAITVAEKDAKKAGILFDFKEEEK